MYGTLIASATVGSGGAANITFSAIPQTFTDLIIVCSIRSASTNQVSWADVAFNGDTATANYNYRTFQGNGSSAASLNGNGGITGQNPGGGTTATIFSNTQIYIPNYADSQTKMLTSETMAENAGAVANQYAVTSNWSNSAAITSIIVKDNGGQNLLQYSTAYLYGLTKI